MHHLIRNKHQIAKNYNIYNQQWIELEQEKKNHMNRKRNIRASCWTQLNLIDVRMHDGDKEQIKLWGEWLHQTNINIL
jgi:hypothetical protein